jgi:ribosome biogenesis GTPase
VPDLTALGWDPAWEQAWQARTSAESPGQPVRVVAEHRGAYQATVGDGVAWCELRGKTFHRAADKRALPTVGDWVIADGWARARDGGGAAIITAVLPRRSLLVRRAAGGATTPQPIAANVDVGIVVTSANKDLSLARLDRYLDLLREGGIAPVVALSKCDLVDDPDALLAALRPLGDALPRIALSSFTGVGLAEIQALVGPGRTGILLGSSGVGKSSLLNRLLGTETQSTGAIRGDERGMHTTTRRELFVTAGGGLWIDTPGMRELALWADDEDDAPSFEDVGAFAAGCRFRDCRHEAEPGCAVQAAVAAGTLGADRLASFHKLATERRATAARQDVAARLAATRRGRARKPPPAR